MIMLNPSLEAPSLEARAVKIAVGVLLLLSGVAEAQNSRFSKTNSQSQYVHRIELYDANELKIDPEDPNAPPYSPLATCGKCHDIESIAHGYHFNAVSKSVDSGRAGEPWIWTDRRTGTQIPLSYRGWAGTYQPEDLGISRRQFVLQFGSHLPGGGPGERPPAPDAESAKTQEPAEGASENESAPGPEVMRWKQSGDLAVDCMMCHDNSGSYSPEAWAEQISQQNFAWAPTAALGLAKVEGVVDKLPEDFDPEATTEEGTPASRLPTTTYYRTIFNADNQVFFNIIRKPRDNACYYCHTKRPVGEGVPPDWTRDEDVHLRAGMSCADCHRNGIGHHTVRGFEGEEHPTGVSVVTLSCRGCHLDEDSHDSEHVAGGRLGSPKPLHAGLPPLHLEKMSCTSCHSGPTPESHVGRVQTAMAHGLGLPSHLYEDDDVPGVVSPALLRDDDTIYPYRMMWPAFWGTLQDDQVTPMDPDLVYAKLRRVLRVRRDFTEEMSTVRLSNADKAEALGEERAKAPDEELTDEEKDKLDRLMLDKAMEEFREKLAKALATLSDPGEKTGGTPIYISGGRAYRLDSEGAVVEFDHEAAKPYAWKLAHDVRPARWSLGASGCYECHTDGAPMFESVVTAVGPAPDRDPPAHAMYELQGLDKVKIDAWNQLFRGRTAFKWIGFVSMGSVAIILLLYLLLGIHGLFGLLRRRPTS